MFKIAALVAAALFLCAAPSAAQERYGSWVLELSEDKESVYISSTNQDGHFLTRSCAISSGDCIWIFSVSATCKEGDEYPVLGNSATGASHLMVRCLEKMGNETGMVFSNFDDAEDLFKGEGVAGIVFPMKSSQFQVFRFAVDGFVRASAAQAARIQDLNAKSTKSIRL